MIISGNSLREEETYPAVIKFTAVGKLFFSSLFSVITLTTFLSLSIFYSYFERCLYDYFLISFRYFSLCKILNDKNE